MPGQRGSKGLGLFSGIAFGPGVKLKAKRIRISNLGASEVDTGWDLPAHSVVLRAYVDIRTEEATATTKTIDVGLLSSESGGDADGILDGIVTSAAGCIHPAVTVTTGSNTKFFASTTYGILMSAFQAGSDVDQDEGLFVIREHLSSAVTAKSISYTLGSAHTELVGSIVIVYLEMR